MGSFISRNGLAALFFLGLMAFAISNLVGSDGEDGLLMKTARDFTGEADVAATSTTSEETVQAVAPVPAPPVPPKPHIEGEFYDDIDLVDAASGYDPTPDNGGPARSELDSDEAMILPQPSVRQSASAEPEAGMLVGNGNIVTSGEDDKDYE